MSVRSVIKRLLLGLTALVVLLVVEALFGSPALAVRDVWVQLHEFALDRADEAESLAVPRIAVGGEQSPDADNRITLGEDLDDPGRHPRHVRPIGMLGIEGQGDPERASGGGLVGHRSSLPATSRRR